MFNEIHIEIVKRSFHNIYVIIFKSFSNFFNCMNKNVVLHKYEIRFVNFEQIVVQYWKIKINWIFFAFEMKISNQNIKIWTFHISKNCSYHDVDVFVFFIWLYHVFISFLIECTKNSLMSFFNVSFNRTFIRSYNFDSIFIFSIFIS